MVLAWKWMIAGLVLFLVNLVSAGRYTRQTGNNSDGSTSYETSGYFMASGAPQPRFCLLVPWTGPCRAYLPGWYFNLQTGTCTQFVYGGCMGNRNRFETFAQCTTTCVTGTPVADSSAAAFGDNSLN